MSVISTAIMAALASNVAGGIDDNSLRERYQTLKDALSQKYGPASDLMQALEQLERKPTSNGRMQVLKEEITALKANDDSELLALAHALLDEISSQLDNDHNPPPSPLRLKRPFRNAKFVGRQKELEQLINTLTTQPAIALALCGPEGIGKSSLAAEIARKLTPHNIPPDSFPDGILYYSFADLARVDLALEQIARTFDEELSPTPYDAIQRALVTRRALLIFDNADLADDLPGLLSIRGGCTVLITCRKQVENVSQSIAVEAPEAAEAVNLLQQWAGDNAQNPAIRQEICDLLGRLPLAIQLAGSYLAANNQDAAGYLTWLKTTSLPNLNPQQRRQESIPLLLERSFAQMSLVARQTLGVISLLATSPFEPKAIIEALAPRTSTGVISTVRKLFGSKIEENLADVEAALDELVRYGLLRQVNEYYQVSHSLILDYAQQHGAVSSNAIRRLATFFVGLTWELGALDNNGQDRLDINRPHFIKLLNKCLEQEEWDVAHGLAIAVENYLDLKGYVTERIIANEIGLIAAWKLGRSNEAAWLGNLGDAYRAMGQAEWAIEHFEKALATARSLGDWQSEGNWLGNLGLAYRDLGDVEQARQYLKESQAIFEEIGSPKAALVRDWLAELEDWEE
jgi:tetratricopeptide (TPR) repeat protein